MERWGYCATLVAAAVTLGGCSFDQSGITDDPTNIDGGGVAIDARSVLDPDAGPPPPDGGSGPDAMVSTLGAYRALRVATPPVLDGERGEWPESSFVTFDIANAALRTGEHPSYANSVSVRFALSHDDTNIYAFFDVTDDMLVDDSAEIYNDDAIALYIDAAGDRTGPYGQDDHEILISSEGFFIDTGPNGAGFTLTGEVHDKTGGYVVEISIAKTALGSSLGSVLGFNLGLIDDDALGSSTADIYGAWFEQAVPHCTNCCAGGIARPWCDTTFFGTLELLP